MKIFLLLIFAFASILAIAFVIQGERLINHLPAIQRFRQAHKAWGRLLINSASIKSNCAINQLGQWRFEEVSDSHNDTDLVAQVCHKRLGDVITVVCYKERHLHHLTKEMRTYSGVFLILLMFGVLLNADQFSEKSVSEIGEAILSHHVIPVLEVIMIAYLLIRLLVETQAINSLLEGD